MADLFAFSSNELEDTLYENGADDEIWMPNDLKRALNLEDIAVILFEDSLKQQVVDNCHESQQVGVTCISSKLNFLVCLTTENKIFVLKMRLSNHVEFLKRLLHKQDLKFFIYRGPIAAYHLQRRFGITLAENVIDLNTLDVFISMREHSFSGLAPKDHYSLTYFYGIRERLTKNTDLKALAEKWTGVKLRMTYHTKKVISNEPYSNAAKNFIKQRAALTRIIGVEMVNKWDQIKYQDVDNIYSFALRASEDTLDLYDPREDNTYHSFNSFLRTLGDIKTEDATMTAHQNFLMMKNSQ